jgi:hypothetical protein
MMKVMVLVRATKESEAGVMPSGEMFEAMGKFNEELVKAGVMKLGDGLKPTSQGKRVHFDGASRTVQDGPFPVNETIAGYWIWEVKDMADALAWASKCPNPMPGPSDLEIRPHYELSDFADMMTAEATATHERVRDKLKA